MGDEKKSEAARVLDFPVIDWTAVAIQDMSVASNLGLDNYLKRRYRQNAGLPPELVDL